METTSEGLVIYRIKFNSKDDFENAAQVLRFGQNMGKYLESLQKSLGLSQSQPNYPTIRPPEVNICTDDLIIYVCSYEYGQSKKGSVITNNMAGPFAESRPQFPYYYEAFLRGTLRGVSDLKITTEKGS